MLTRSAYARQRVLECVPAVLLALALLVPVLLWAYSARIAYLVLCGYLIFWAIRSVDLAVRQTVEFFRMRTYRELDWDARLAGLSDPFTRLAEFAEVPRLSRMQIEERQALLTWTHAGGDVPAPQDVYQLIVVPVTNEAAEIIEQTLDAILATGYESRRLMVCLSFEARSQEWDVEQIARLEDLYADRFGMLLTTQHPDGLPGEGRVKGANITWAARVARTELLSRGIDDHQVLVSAFDCDTRPSHHYFRVLTWTHLTNPNRDVDSYQPILLFHNNVWEVPAPSRLVGYIASMWTMVDSTNPSRLRIFSSHAMGMQALVRVGFWATNVIPDDSRQYWRMYFATDGRAATRPLHVPVYLDAVHAKSYLHSLSEQYRQIRRWSYGVIDFPYIVGQNLANGRIPWGPKLLQTYRQLAVFHQWAITPVIVIVARWLVSRLEPYALATGNPYQPIGFWLSDYPTDLIGRVYAITPFVTIVSLVVGAVVALALLPKRPDGRPLAIYLKMALEWLLLPIVVPLFFCLPAIDAQVRLAARRYLGFRVTVKNRSAEAHQVR